MKTLFTSPEPISGLVGQFPAIGSGPADRPLALCLYLARQRQTAAVPDAALDAVLTARGLRAYWPAAPVTPIGG